MRAWAWPAGLTLAGALIILIVIPFALMLYLLIGFWFIGMQPAMPFIAVPLLLLALMLTLFAPQMDLLACAFTTGREPGRRRWLAPALAGLVALVFLTAGSFSSGTSTSQPLPSGVWYMLDADSGEAAWYSYGERPADPWTAQFFPGAIQSVDLSQVYAATPGNPVPAGFRGAAPAGPLAPPQLVVTSDPVAAGQRTILLHLTSPRGARGLRVRASGAPVLAAEVNGVRRSEPTWAERNEWYLRYYGLTPAGIDLKLEVAPAAGLSLQVTDQADGLPELPGVTYAPRTASMMPFAIAQEYMPYPETNSVTKQFELQ